MDKRKWYREPLACCAALFLYYEYMTATFTATINIAVEYGLKQERIVSILLFAAAIYLFGKFVTWSNNIYKSKYGLRYILIAGIYSMNTILVYLETTAGMESVSAYLIDALAYYLITSSAFIAWGISESR